MLGLSGQDPEYIPVDNIDGIKTIKEHQQIKLGDEFLIPDPAMAIVFNKEFLPFHSNGMTFTATQSDKYTATYYYWWWFCCKRRTYQCQEKNSYKMCFSFLNRSDRAA
jgi:L-serine dehydratase